MVLKAGLTRRFLNSRPSKPHQLAEMRYSHLYFSIGSIIFRTKNITHSMGKMFIDDIKYPYFQCVFESRIYPVRQVSQGEWNNGLNVWFDTGRVKFVSMKKSHYNSFYCNNLVQVIFDSNPKNLAVFKIFITYKRVFISLRSSEKYK